MVKQSLHFKRAAVSLAAVAAFGASGVVSAQGLDSAESKLFPNYVTDDMLLNADKDAQNEFGDTALIIASRNGNTALARRLVNAGASTRLRNKDRLTAADVAAARSFPGLADLLKGT